MPGLIFLPLKTKIRASDGQVIVTPVGVIYPEPGNATIEDVRTYYLRYLGRAPHDDAEAIGYGRIGKPRVDVELEIATSDEAIAYLESHGIPAQPTLPAPPPPTLASSSNPWRYPITQPWNVPQADTTFSPVHTGIDFAMPAGTPLIPLRDGTVIAAGPSTDGRTGIFLEVEYADGMVAWFAHLSSVAVGAGARVKAMDWIGNSGSSGESTGPHLHLELHRGRGNLGTMQSNVDPASYFTELQSDL